MKIKFVLFIALLGMGFMMSSCGKDEPELTDCEKTAYNDEVKAIINKSCNTSGCHDGVNEMRKPMTTFSEVSAISGGIMKRALTDRNMPPADSSFDALTDDEREIIKCWLDNGKKEN